MKSELGKNLWRNLKCALSLSADHLSRDFILKYIVFAYYPGFTNLYIIQQDQRNKNGFKIFLHNYPYNLPLRLTTKGHVISLIIDRFL